MIPYIVTFFIPALIAMMQPVHKPWKRLEAWIPVAIYLIIFIGLRDNVGSDWANYLRIFHRDAMHMSYMDALTHEDPAFYLLMVWVAEMGWTIHVVYLVSSVFFTLGLVIFVRRMPNPWLALVVAIGYTVLTSGMGYVRHGVAFGFSLWAITALLDRRFIKFFILVATAATFHKSAVIMLGFGLFYGGKGKYLKVLATIIIGAGIYAAFMSGNEEGYVKLYIKGNLESSGAYIRTFMNVIPAFFFFYFRKKWKRFWPDGYTLWYLMALGVLFTVPMVMAFSTATDRISMYLIPLQFVVFSHLPLLFRGNMAPKTTTFLIVGYYGLVYFVWLNFASWASFWTPYHNILPIWWDGWLY